MDPGSGLRRLPRFAEPLEADYFCAVCNTPFVNAFSAGCAGRLRGVPVGPARLRPCGQFRLLRGLAAQPDSSVQVFRDEAAGAGLWRLSGRAIPYPADEPFEPWCPCRCTGASDGSADSIRRNCWRAFWRKRRRYSGVERAPAQARHGDSGGSCAVRDGGAMWPALLSAATESDKSRARDSSDRRRDDDRRDGQRLRGRSETRRERNPSPC